MKEPGEDTEMLEILDSQPTTESAPAATQEEKGVQKKATAATKSKSTSDPKRSRAKLTSNEINKSPNNPALEVETLFLNALRERKVSLSFKDLINLSPPFAKFLCQLTTKHRNSKPSSEVEHTVRVSSLAA